MVIDAKFIGKEYPETSFEIGREKLKEFIIATKGDSIKYSDIVSPTFPVVFQHEILGGVLFDQDLNLNLRKLVHGEQEFIYHKPVKVGDTIKTTAKIEKIFQKGPHDFVVLKSSSKNQLNELACESIWTFVIRGGNDKDFTMQEKLFMAVAGLLPPCPKKKAAQKKAFATLAEKADFEIDLEKPKQDLWVYDKLSETDAAMQVFIDKYMPQVYAGASGDFNVIHLDEAFGRRVGLGGNILHGMATMALGANFATYEIDPRNLKRYKARFSAVVKPMDTLTYRGKFSKENKVFEFNAVNQSGSEVLSSAMIELA